MYSGREICEFLQLARATHVVWLPDSYLGQWEAELHSSSAQLVRVCREGEAWTIAAGLQLGGQRPIVMMQTTGLFESGDSLRNVAYDLRLPVFGVIGARNWLNASSRDSAKHFARPILDAWQIDYVVIESPSDKPLLAKHWQACQEREISGLVVIGEAK